VPTLLILLEAFHNKLKVSRPSVNCMGCPFKFPVKVGVEESIVNASAVQILPQFLRCLCFYTSGAFTIDSSTPTLPGNLNEHPLHSWDMMGIKLTNLQHPPQIHRNMRYKMFGIVWLKKKLITLSDACLEAFMNG
jgi:hypothetical protein